MDSSRHSGSGKLIVDSIHGDIHLTSREVEVIDTASFQRLRQLKQLAMAQLVYPGATHTRFAHSIGALGIMARIIQVAKVNKIPLEPEMKENLRLAALLHDIGHYPYSHLMENLDGVKLTEEEIGGVKTIKKEMGKNAYPEHVEVGEFIITGQDDLVKALGGEKNAKAVADIFTRSKAADPQLSKFIHSSFDIDRWDYLLRDSYGTGVPYGQIDINYLLNNMKVSPQGVVGFSAKALPAVEHLLLGRFFMHRAVYYHKTIYGLEEVCRQLLRRLRDNNEKSKNYGIPVDREAIKKIVTGPELFTFTDAFVDNIIQEAVNDENEVIKVLASSVQKRRPPVLLKEVQVCEEKERELPAGKTFRLRCKYELNDLAYDFHIPLEQFLLCETKPLSVGDRPETLTAGKVSKLKPEEVIDHAFEEEEKDIKIFVGDDDRAEPVSLMDIKHSLVAKYAAYSFQIFRLYVVYDGKKKDKVVAELKNKVKDWDKS